MDCKYWEKLFNIRGKREIRMRERILETAKKERSAHHHHEKSKIQPLTQDYKLGVRRATKSFNQNV